MYLKYICKQVELDLLVCDDNNVIYDPSSRSAHVSHSGVWLPTDPELVEGKSLIHLDFG